MNITVMYYEILKSTAKSETKITHWLLSYEKESNILILFILTFCVCNICKWILKRIELFIQFPGPCHLFIFIISIDIFSIKTETDILFNKLFRTVIHLRFYKLACHSFVNASKRNEKGNNLH